jgi:hypothetical protein
VYDDLQKIRKVLDEFFTLRYLAKAITTGTVVNEVLKRLEGSICFVIAVRT